MIDNVQLILLTVIVILTALLVLLGVQVFFILKELRTTIKKTNRVLDNADAITQDIEGPLSAISSLVLGVQGASFFTIAKLLKTLLGRDKDSDERKRDRD